jgi:hypothetical protein
MAKVDRELEEAIKKHGKVTPPYSFITDFQEKVENEKQKVAAQF